MVRIIFLFISLLTLENFSLLAQTDAPPDVGSIELLIARHKKQHDRLEERNNNEIKHNSVTALVKDISTKYEKLHKDLMSKYALASQWFNLGLNALDIVTELNLLRKAIPPFLANVNKIHNPYVLLKYVQAGKKIKSEIEFCIKVASSIPAIRINAEELTEISELIKEHISRIRYLISSYAMIINGQVLYNKFYEKPKLPDYTRIATEVINEYYKKD